MQCKSCGHTNEAGSRFCERCGAPMAQPADAQYTPPAEPTDTRYSQYMPPAEPTQAPFAPPVPPVAAEHREERAPRRKGGTIAIVLGVLCALLAAALVLTLLGVTDSVFSPAKTFAEPEDAVQYFLDRVKAADLDGAMSACAVDEAAQNYDYEAAIDRFGAMGLNVPVFMPSDYALYTSYNQYTVQNQIAGGLRMMALSSTLPEEYEGYLGYVTVPESSGDIQFSDVVKDMDPGAFLEMEIVKIQPNGYEDDAYSDYLEETAAIYGADEMAARDVLFKIDGNYYAGGFMLLRYGESWKIIQVGDPAIAQPATGALIPLDSKSDFDSLLNSAEGGDVEESAAVTETAPATTEAAPASAANTLSGMQVGLSMTGDNSGWTALLANDLIKNAEGRGAEIIANFGSWDLDIQAEQIETLIVQGCDVIIVWTYDVSSSQPALQQAQEAGIYVIMLIASEPIEANGTSSAFIGFDKREFGNTITDWMYDNLGGDLRIGELTSGPDSTVTTDLSGALTEAVTAHPQWKIVSTVNGGYGQSDAYTAAQNMLTMYSDIDVLYCHSDALALGAAQAVQEAGLQDEVSVVCMGESQAIIDAVADSSIRFAVMNDLHMGEAILDVANQLVQGSLSEARIYLDPLLVDSSNAASLSGYSY